MHYTEAEKGDYYRSLLAGVAKLDVVTIAPARHFVMLDQPERFRRRSTTSSRGSRRRRRRR